MTLNERDIYDEIVRLNRLLISYKNGGRDTDFILDQIKKNIERLDNLQMRMQLSRQCTLRSKRRR